MTPPDPVFAFENSFLEMPGHFFARVAPTRVATPTLIALNRGLCAELGIDADALQRVAPQTLSGNELPQGAASIAMTYAGHQFGNFVPQLGDGRAILLGEVIGRDGARKDLQLKGAGPTPFSRRGDGRSALGPVLREFLVSEAMHALGIPTTRALAAVSTGEQVFREGPLPGAVFTRVASSHIRIGTFEYFAAKEDYRGVETLARHVISRHYPELKNVERPFLPLVESIVERQASLVARWMLVGFVHGVMNTDNMSVSGETIDYGPCAFLDRYDPATVFSSIDRGGRYAFANQPGIAQWNLARLAETLVPLMDPNTETALELATNAIRGFSARFEAHWLSGMRRKMGLANEEPEDIELAQTLLSAMYSAKVDYTLTFRRLCSAAGDSSANTQTAALLGQAGFFESWTQQWRARLARDPQSAVARRERMLQINPAVIPRNRRVEEAIGEAVERGNFSPFHTLHEVLGRPFEERPEWAPYAEPPPADAPPYRTFCGT